MGMWKPAGSWSWRALVAPAAALTIMSGCATTKPAPYALSSESIGVAVASLPKTKLATVESAAGSGFISGAAAAGKGAAFLGPLVILLAPFTAAWGAAEGVSCDQKVAAAYPGLLEKFPGIVERELSLEDLQDQFVGHMQKYTSAPVSAEEIRYGNDNAANEQQILVTAAEHGRAHLFLIGVSGVAFEAKGSECSAWQVRPRFGVQLWRVADRKLVFSFSPRAALPSGSLLNLSSVLDEPGALRSQLGPTYDAAAADLLLRGGFSLPR